jgi:hypothetical protein
MPAAENPSVAMVEAAIGIIDLISGTSIARCSRRSPRYGLDGLQLLDPT